MASSDTDNDIIIGSALLIASTLYQRCQVNVRKRKRNSWAVARKQTIDQSQLSDRARNCRRIEMVSIKKFSWSTCQKLGNSRCHTGNLVELCNKVALLCCVSDMSQMSASTSMVNGLCLVVAQLCFRINHRRTHIIHIMWYYTVVQYQSINCFLSVSRWF